MADIKALAEQLVNLTVKEVNELATVLKEEYGIEPAAAAVAVAAPAAAGDAAPAEKSTFDVFLKSVGQQPTTVYKEVKHLTGMASLIEAKKLADTAPNAKLAEGVSKEKAEEFKSVLEGLGAEVELK